MATLTVYPDANPETTSVDGVVGRTSVDESWATIRAGAGVSADDGGATQFLTILATATTNQWAFLRRWIFLFDTNALGANATISAAVLSLKGASKLDNLAVAPDLDIYTSTPATNTALVAADYSQLGSTSQTGSPISYASFNTAAYNDFTLNATGVSNISKTGVSKFGARNVNYDVSGTPPTWSASAQSNFEAYFSEQASTTSDPKLVVTYTLTNGNFFLVM